MAYVDPLKKDDEENKNNQEIATSSTDNAPNSTVVGGGQASNAQAPSQGGGGAKGWTNLQDYVGANAHESGKLGAAVGSQVQGSVQGLNNQQQAYSTNYNNQKPTGNKEQNTATLTGLSQGKIADNKDALSSLYNYEYKGPKSTADVKGYQEAQNTANNDNLLNTDFNDFSGRQSALQSIYGKKGSPYTAGQQSLDSFILGAAAPGQQELQKANTSIANSKNSWKQTLADVAKSIGEDSQYAADTKIAARKAIDDTYKQENTDLGGARANLDKENTDKIKALDELQNLIDSGDPTAYDKLGIDKNTADFIKNSGLNLSSFYNVNGLRGLGDVVNDKDAANYQALSDITGNSPSYNFDKTGNAATAYTANADKVGAASQAGQLQSLVKQQLADTQSQRDQQYQQIRDQLASLASPLSFVPRTAGEIKYGADTLGISEADFKDALDRGINPLDYVKQGTNLNTGDVATKAQRDQWNTLRAQLGLPLDNSLEDTQDEGRVFNAGDLAGALSSMRDWDAAHPYTAPETTTSQDLTDNTIRNKKPYMKENPRTRRFQ